MFNFISTAKAFFTTVHSASEDCGRDLSVRMKEKRISFQLNTRKAYFKLRDEGLHEENLQSFVQK